MARGTTDDYREMLGNNLKPADNGLAAVDSVIHELDDAIQDTGNLKLSKTLNDIYDSFQSIRELMKAPGR